MESKTQFPILKWAQRKNLLFVTINVVPVKPPTVDIIDGKKLKYTGTDTNNFAFEIELYDEVVKEESKYTLDSRNAFLNIKKKTSGPHWPRLTKDTVKYQWIQFDWSRYVDEDEENESVPQPDFEGQDFGAGEMDEDDEPPKDEHECGCGHDHHHEHEEKKEEGKNEETIDTSKKAEGEEKKEGDDKEKKHKKKKEAPTMIVIEQAKRGKKKHTTYVSNLEKFGLVLKDVAKQFSKKFACSCTVTKEDNGTECITLTGEFADDVFDFLTTTFPNIKPENCQVKISKK